MSQSKGDISQAGTSQHGATNYEGQNDSISALSKNTTDMRRGQRQRKFKKESTIYGIPVKNSSNLDMSQQMNMIDGSELISP